MPSAYWKARRIVESAGTIMLAIRIGNKDHANLMVKNLGRLAAWQWELQEALPSMEAQVNRSRHHQPVVFLGSHHPNALRAAAALATSITDIIRTSLYADDIIRIVLPKADSPACGAEAWEQAYRAAFHRAGIVKEDASAGRKWTAFCKRCAVRLPSWDSSQIQTAIELELSAISVGADTIADSTKKPKKSFPTNSKAIELARRLIDPVNQDRTKIDIAREFCHENETEAETLLRSVRRHELLGRVGNK